MLEQIQIIDPILDDSIIIVDDQIIYVHDFLLEEIPEEKEFKLQEETQ